jgi:probable rRNA maturation factor
VIIIETPLDGVDRRELVRFAGRAQKLVGISGQVAILIAGNAQLRDLNRRFRRKDKPTDVLSFPREGGGDIAISAQIAAENAVRFGHAPMVELKILVLHGMLHLAGYDHETDQGEMGARESALRKQLGLPDSLTERGHTRTARRRRA